MRIFLVLACLLLGVLTGCGFQGAPDQAADRGSSSTSESGVADPLGFSSVTTSGEDFDGSSLSGRPAVLWFWAPWCPTCRGQIPGVTALADEYGDQVGIVGVGSLDDQGPIDDFAAEAKGVTHLADEDGEVWRHFGVTEQSVYVVLDKDGTIVSEGYLDDAELADLVAGLVD